MLAHDPLFVKVLLWIEELGRRTFRPEDLLDMAADLQLDANDLVEAVVVVSVGVVVVGVDAVVLVVVGGVCCGRCCRWWML